MRNLIFLCCLGFVACKGKNTPKPHDPVKGAAMWRVQLVDLSIQALDDSDKPKGSPESISERDEGQFTCRTEADPGSEPVTTWISGSVDDTGHVRMTHERDKAVPGDVNGCAHQAAANIKLKQPPGEYKLTMTVTFSDPQLQ
jgi:hypothetical protein